MIFKLKREGLFIKNVPINLVWIGSSCPLCLIAKYGVYAKLLICKMMYETLRFCLGSFKTIHAFEFSRQKWAKMCLSFLLLQKHITKCICDVKRIKNPDFICAEYVKSLIFVQKLDFDKIPMWAFFGKSCNFKSKYEHLLAKFMGPKIQFSEKITKLWIFSCQKIN